MKGVIVLAGILAGFGAGLVLSKPAPEPVRLQANKAPAPGAPAAPDLEEFPTVVAEASGPKIISTSTLLGRQPPTRAVPVRSSSGPSGQAQRPAAPAGRPAQRC